MVADRIHLVRHGEVHNPEGVLYGRLPNFGLSDLGHKMAAEAANQLQNSGRKITALYCSPLQRTRESANPIAKAFGLTAIIDEKFIEPHNIFEGKVIRGARILLKPHLWFHLRNPSEPSWGEPYEHIVARMNEGILEAAEQVAHGDLVIVSHQLPIWMVHSLAVGAKYPHNPTQRRCALSSITSFEIKDGKLVEVDYRDPSEALRESAKDVGAV
jgi:broad specificity phosphatase PhoE